QFRAEPIRLVDDLHCPRSAVQYGPLRAARRSEDRLRPDSALQLTSVGALAHQTGRVGGRLNYGILPNCDRITFPWGGNMRLVYACVLIAGFNLDWKWYVLAFTVWATGVSWMNRALIAEFICELEAGRPPAAATGEAAAKAP